MDTRYVIGSNETLRCLPRFLTVGMASTLVDLTLFTALHIAVGLPALPANSISYSAGFVTAFALHRRWTYAGRPRKALAAQFRQFALVGITALLLNNLMVVLLAAPLGALLARPGYGSILAKVGATGIGLCWNFVVNNFWTFRANPEGVNR